MNHTSVSISDPTDLKRPWLSVARRMQSVAQTEGYAVITIRVLVGPDGCPRAWLEPHTCRIEPRRLATDSRGAMPEELLAALAGDLEA